MMRALLTRWKLITALSAALLVALLLWMWLKPENTLTLTNFETTTVQRGNLTKNVTASGIINPVNVVSVGSQTSGIIEQIFVDYNDRVSASQVLAQLDTSVLQAQLNDAESAVAKAQSQLKLARISASRNRELYKQSFISKAEVDQTDANLDSAQADVVSAQSALTRAQANLGYATVRSPVSGVVVSRAVNVGQTVAASFQTPELFKIAEDLTLMQIEASVSEADIGGIKDGQPVTFTVDAYSDKTFTGTVKQVRLNPTTDQNVVTYTVIIEVANPDLKLLPGMTAYVSITLEARENVLFVDNAAFRFVPPATLLEKMGKGGGKNATSRNVYTLYVIKNDEITQVNVQRGLSTLTQSEVASAALAEGDKVITSYTGKATARKAP